MLDLLERRSEQLTQEDTKCILRLVAAAAAYLEQGNTKKTVRILSDIGTHFSADNASTKTISGDISAQIEIPCSTCAGYLPNEALYLACLASCTG
jgi:hypothetical protein